MDNETRIFLSLRILTPYLADYVYKNLKDTYSDNWWEDGVIKKLKDHQRRELPLNGSDKQLLEKLDIDRLTILIADIHWSEMFSTISISKFRTYIRELRDIRNTFVGHLGSEQNEEREVERSFDTISRILEIIGQESKINDLNDLLDKKIISTSQKESSIPKVADVSNRSPENVIVKTIQHFSKLITSNLNNTAVDNFQSINVVTLPPHIVNHFVIQEFLKEVRDNHLTASNEDITNRVIFGRGTDCTLQILVEAYISKDLDYDVVGETIRHYASLLAKNPIKKESYNNLNKVVILPKYIANHFVMQEFLIEVRENHLSASNEYIRDMIISKEGTDHTLQILVEGYISKELDKDVVGETIRRYASLLN